MTNTESPEPGTTAKVVRFPKCDIHSDHDAQYDCSIIYNGRRTWANICQELFDDPALGAGLGLGRGQRLTLADPDETYGEDPDWN